MQKYIIVSNNPLLSEKINNDSLTFIKGGTLEVLKLVRDYIHKGCTLLTHPMAGSLKPNEMPYKTVILKAFKHNGETIDVKSLTIIEDVIITTEKFLKDFTLPEWSENTLLDFQYIDYDLIFNSYGGEFK